MKLIKEGAEPVADAKDILDFFKISPKFSKKTTLPASALSELRRGKSFTLEERIIDQLKREPLKADEMARLFVVPVAQLGTALSLMQLKGFINQDNGKYYIN